MPTFQACHAVPLCQGWLEQPGFADTAKKQAKSPLWVTFCNVLHQCAKSACPQALGSLNSQVLLTQQKNKPKAPCGLLLAMCYINVQNVHVHKRWKAANFKHVCVGRSPKFWAKLRSQSHRSLHRINRVLYMGCLESRFSLRPTWCQNSGFTITVWHLTLANQNLTILPVERTNRKTECGNL